MNITPESIAAILSAESTLKGGEFAIAVRPHIRDLCAAAEERDEWKERYEALAKATVGTSETFKDVLAQRDTLRAELKETKASLADSREHNYEHAAASIVAENRELRAEVERWKSVASEQSQMREHNANVSGELKAEVERLKAFVGNEEWMSDFKTAAEMRSEIIEADAAIELLRRQIVIERVTIDAKEAELSQLRQEKERVEKERDDTQARYGSAIKDIEP